MTYQIFTEIKKQKNHPPHSKGYIFSETTLTLQFLQPKWFTISKDSHCVVHQNCHRKQKDKRDPLNHIPNIRHSSSFMPRLIAAVALFPSCKYLNLP